MRNLILSAFPRNMRLPDPFTPNLKVDMLAEIAHAPRVLTNFASMIQPINFKKVFSDVVIQYNYLSCQYLEMSTACNWGPQKMFPKCNSHYTDE
jgi:hypothetical protein